MASSSANPPPTHHVWLVFSSNGASPGKAISAHRSKPDAMNCITARLGWHPSDYQSKVNVLRPGLELIHGSSNTDGHIFRRTCLLQWTPLDVLNPESGPQTPPGKEFDVHVANQVYVVYKRDRGFSLLNDVVVWASTVGVVDVILHEHRARIQTMLESARNSWQVGGLSNFAVNFETVPFLN